MDELEIDGKKYLSSKRAAREHKYHIDYIGQLIRAGKVVGKKVGRSWYVEAESLRSYLAAESAAPQTPVQASQPQAHTPVAHAQPIVSLRDPSPSPFEPVRTETVEVEERVVMTRQEEPEYSAPVSRQTIYEEPMRSVQSAPAHKPATLTYIEDTEPMLPALNGRIRSNADFVAIPMRKIAEPEATEEEIYEEEAPKVIVHERKVRKIFSFGKIQTLAIIAVVMLALAALGSTLLATSIRVVDGGTASVGFTIK